MSAKDQALQPPAPSEPPLVQDTYSAYELEWETLKGFLETLFPEIQFKEKKSVCSSTFGALL